MTENGLAIAIIVVLVIFIIGGIIWYIIALNNLAECQSVESSICPQYYCLNPSDQCKNDPQATGASGSPAFRKRPDGSYQCQQYTIAPTSTKTDHTTPAINPSKNTYGVYTVPI